MNQTTYKINTDIVSTIMKDKPLIFISEEAINLKRDNDNLKSIIKEAIEYIENNFISYEDSRTFGQLGEEIDIEVKEIRELLNILKGSDKE